MFLSNKAQSALGTGLAGILALTALSGCVVSDDPAVNAIATTAAIGTVAGLIYYSNDDGYYYDDRYNRMPRGYRPAYDTRVQRIDSMDAYRRRAYERDIIRRREENRMMQSRLEQQRRENAYMQDRLERQRGQNMRMREQMEQQRARNIEMRRQMQQQSEFDRSRMQRQGAAERASFRTGGRAWGNDMHMHQAPPRRMPPAFGR